MENKEEIYTALEGNIITWCIELKYKFVWNVVVEFRRLPNGAVPEVLDKYLHRVAATGVTMYVLPVFLLMLLVVIIQFCVPNA